MKLRTENKRKAAYNIGLAIWRLKCFYETFVQGSTAVILLNFCAKNPPPSPSPKPLAFRLRNDIVHDKDIKQK